MNQEKLNMSLRKFLKEVGVTSQRKIEQAVQASGKSAGKVKIVAMIKADGINLDHKIEGTIDLG